MPQTELLQTAGLAAVALGASATGVYGLRGLLRRRRVLDVPNERSSHAHPVPRGAGLAVVPVVLVLWAVAAPECWPLLAAAAGLAAVSWADDVGHVPAAVRLAAQFAAVTAALLAFPLPGPVFAGLLPPVAETAAVAVLWVWFVNAFNFMDGIDAISAVETVAIGAGVVLVALVGGLAPAAQGPIVAAAALGFLVWNRPPATIFLGDVGSTGLGFLCGWLLLDLAARGQPAAALTVALYYLADATITLVRRAARGEKIWQAHREHFYQKAVQAGHGHGQVAFQVALLDVGLIACAAVAAATGRPWLGLAIGAVLVALTLHHFGRRA